MGRCNQVLTCTLPMCRAKSIKLLNLPRNEMKTSSGNLKIITESHQGKLCDTKKICSKTPLEYHEINLVLSTLVHFLNILEY